MSAQPIAYDDPRDPASILSRLPECAREPFLEEYRAAVDAAHQVAGYRALQALLQSWSTRATAYERPDFMQTRAAAARPADDDVTLEELTARRMSRP